MSGSLPSSVDSSTHAQSPVGEDPVVPTQSVARVLSHTLDARRRRILFVTTQRAIIAGRALPRRSARFYVRASIRSLALEDRWSFWSALPPQELSVLVDLARDRKSVVELGTGTAWTTFVLALAEPGRQVRTYDTQVKPQRPAYVALADVESRARVAFVEGRGEEAELPETPVDLLYVDSNHSRDVVRRSFEHWRPTIAQGGFVVFDDYVNDHYPGVRQAVADLGLHGRTEGRLFVWQNR
jgi:predicted O-methyltransferase YrrM